jgi:hypothetical protein
VLHPVLPAGPERLLGHPHHHRVERPVDARQVVRPHQHVAAADVDLVLERQRHRLRRERLARLAVPRVTIAFTRLRAPEGSAITSSPRARCRRPPCREAPEVEVGPVHVLHREAEVDQVPVRRDVDGLEVVQQRLTAYHGIRLLGSTTLSPLSAETG